MKTLTERYITEDGTVLTTKTHIYAEHGVFMKDGHPQGWHIELGTGASADDYEELDTGEDRTIPEYLPDVIVLPEPEDEEEATAEEIAEALEGIL